MAQNRTKPASANRRLAIGDDRQDILKAPQESAEADVVLITGGLVLLQMILLPVL